MLCFFVCVCSPLPLHFSISNASVPIPASISFACLDPFQFSVNNNVNNIRNASSKIEQIGQTLNGFFDTGLQQGQKPIGAVVL